MDTKHKGLHRAIIAAAILIVWATNSVQVAADVITTDIENLAIYCGRSIWIDKDSSISAAIAAKKTVSTGKNVSLKDVYAEGAIAIGRSATVRGRVLSNSSADAERQLDFQGVSWKGSSVSLDRDANVTGDIYADTGGINISRNARITGNVEGNCDIQFDRDSTLTGNVTLPAENTLSTGKNVTITGSIYNANVSVDTFSCPSMPDAPVANPYGPEDILRGKNTTTNLDPGDYRNLNLWGVDATLNITSGAYTFRNVWISGGGQINIDTSCGDVIMNVHRGLSTGKEVTFNKSGEGDLIINVFDKNVWLGHDTAIEASVRVWDGKFETGSGVNLTGSIWADKDINLGQNTTVMHISTIPEPATITLILCGGALLAARRRRV